MVPNESGMSRMGRKKNSDWRVKAGAARARFSTRRAWAYTTLLALWLAGGLVVCWLPVWAFDAAR